MDPLHVFSWPPGMKPPQPPGWVVTLMIGVGVALMVVASGSGDGCVDGVMVAAR